MPMDLTMTNISVDGEPVCREWLLAKFEQVYRQAVLDERREAEYRKPYLERNLFVDHVLGDVLESKRRQVARNYVLSMERSNRCQYCEGLFVGTIDEHESTCPEMPDEYDDYDDQEFSYDD